ncbi:MAG TPA: hypothetical protein VIM02_03800 [Rhizomicrobium sp.]|jgi:hypothetical protein
MAGRCWRRNDGPLLAAEDFAPIEAIARGSEKERDDEIYILAERDFWGDHAPAQARSQRWREYVVYSHQYAAGSHLTTSSISILAPLFPADDERWEADIGRSHT